MILKSLNVIADEKNLLTLPDKATYIVQKQTDKSESVSSFCTETKERRDCMTEKFYSVEDVMQILGISKSAACKIMRQMNDELKKKGFVIIRGKVSRRYFEECIYGLSDVG